MPYQFDKRKVTLSVWLLYGLFGLTLLLLTLSPHYSLSVTVHLVFLCVWSWGMIMFDTFKLTYDLCIQMSCQICPNTHDTALTMTYYYRIVRSTQISSGTSYYSVFFFSNSIIYFPPILTIEMHLLWVLENKTVAFNTALLTLLNL